MTKKELYETTFIEAVNELSEDHYITTYHELKDFAKLQIDDDNLLLALHIVTAINENTADYYSYDYSMGTLEIPTPLNDSSDLEDYCEEDED